MTLPESEPDMARKRLLWRATHRGIKEMDIIIGGFASAQLHRMTPAETASFSTLLDLPDKDYLSWITGQADVPPDIDCDLLRQILAFRIAH